MEVVQNGPSIRCVQYSSVSVPFLSNSGYFWKMDEWNTKLIMTVAVEHHTDSRFHIWIVIDGKHGHNPNGRGCAPIWVTLVFDFWYGDTGILVRVPRNETWSHSSSGCNLGLDRWLDEVQKNFRNRHLNWAYSLRRLIAMGQGEKVITRITMTSTPERV